MKHLRQTLFWIVPWAAAAAALIFHFCVLEHYTAYPWWHSFGNDIDGAYAGQTLSLLNGSDISLVDHPGGGVYMVQGTVYRVAAALGGRRNDFLDVRGAGSLNAAMDLLDQAVRIGRVLALAAVVVFLLVYARAVTLWVGPGWPAALMIFYLGTSTAVAFYSYSIRPEIYNVLFLGLALWLALRFRASWSGGLQNGGPLLFGMGLALGLSVLSKIQIGPALILFLAGFLFWLARRAGREGGPILPAQWGTLWLNHAALWGIIPWWALVRPSFLNDNYFRHLGMSDKWKVYGPAPESFIPLAAGLCLGITVITGIAQFLACRNARVAGRFFIPIQGLHGILLGMASSVYLVLAPVSVTWSGYIANTRHLVYAMLTNGLYGGFLVNRVIDSGTFQKILAMHADQSRLLGISILYYVAVAGLAALWRLMSRPGRGDARYGWAIFLFAVGLVFDILGTMRWYHLMYYYAMYSNVFYTLGLGLWLGAESAREHPVLHGRSWGQMVRVVVAGVLVLQVWLVAESLICHPRASGKTDQSPMAEWLNVRAHAPAFIDMAEQLR